MHVPRSGNVLEGNVERAAFTRSERRVAGIHHLARFAKGDLVHLVEKLDGDFDGADGALAAIYKLAGKGGDFLVQEILRAAEGQVLNTDLRSIGALLGAEWRMNFRRSASRRRLPARPQEKAGQHDQQSRRREQQGETKRAAIAVMLAIRMALRRRWDARACAIYALTLALIFVHSRSVWEEVYAFGRVFSPLLLLIALEELGANPWLACLPMFLADTRVSLDLASQLRGILRGMTGF